MQTRYLNLTHQIPWPPRYLEHHERQGARVNIFAISAPPPLRGDSTEIMETGKI